MAVARLCLAKVISRVKVTHSVPKLILGSIVLILNKFVMSSSLWFQKTVISLSSCQNWNLPLVMCQNWLRAKIIVIFLEVERLPMNCKLWNIFNWLWREQDRCYYWTVTSLHSRLYLLHFWLWLEKFLQVIKWRETHDISVKNRSKTVLFTL